MPKKILFVAMPESVHTARWISQIADQGWDLYLFPSTNGKPHADLRNITVFGSYPFRPSGLAPTVKYKTWTSSYLVRDFLENRIRHRSTRLKEIALAKVIRAIKPDLIQSLEIQHAGYLTLGAKELLPLSSFPRWVVTNWGSDISLFGRLAEHKPKIEQVLANCDYYSAECERDIELARRHGFARETLPVFPNAGGYDLQRIAKLKFLAPPSQRKVIMLKGYQTWSGRALVGLSALRMCVDDLKGYEIVIYSASEDVRIAAELFEQDTNLKVTILPQTSHEEILRNHGRARISIGLSISDAISTSLLDAMVMGSYPIQSCTACATEWIVNGKSGSIVPPEEPWELAAVIKKALCDAHLVDSAFLINQETVKARLDREKIKLQVVQMYQKILGL